MVIQQKKCDISEVLCFNFANAKPMRETCNVLQVIGGTYYIWDVHVENILIKGRNTMGTDDRHLSK